MTHRTEAIVEADGKVTVVGLPFEAGQRVEVIVTESAPKPAVEFPMRGPYRFDDPFTPVALEDWEALR